MPRAANAIDFWRGFALISIFINHIDGNFYSSLTHMNYSISDAAELFVFLAGWAVCLVAGKLPTGVAIRKFLGRAGAIYAAQILVAVVAIAILTAAAWALRDQALREWVNAETVFDEPWRAALGLATLTYHLDYLSVLPLYVVLMVLTPGIVALDRYAPRLLLPLSFTIYVATLLMAAPMPTWPDDGEWFFHPLAWQFVFVLGFVLAKDNGIGSVARTYLPTLRWIAIPVLVLGLMAKLSGVLPDPDNLPGTLVWLSDDKTFATPVRLVQFLALVAAFSAMFPYIQRYAATLAEFGSRLGRNSLLVFSLGSLLSLSGELIRHVAGGGLLVDTLVIGAGIALMGIAAVLSERGTPPRDRIPREKPERLRPAMARSN
jgi:hypothetical protein